MASRPNKTNNLSWIITYHDIGVSEFTGLTIWFYQCLVIKRCVYFSVEIGILSLRYSLFGVCSVGLWLHLLHTVTWYTGQAGATRGSVGAGRSHRQGGLRWRVERISQWTQWRTAVSARKFWSSGLKKLFVSCNPTLTSFYSEKSLPLSFFRPPNSQST